MIRKAMVQDLESIMKIINDVKEEMRTEGSRQWDEKYPQTKDFLIDIECETLYVEEIDGQIAGFICINYIEPEEYSALRWSLNDKALILHRMAINLKFRNRGIGMKLLTFAETLAKNNGIYYLKSDTYSLNTKMNSLFKKLCYNFVGEIYAFEKTIPFYCYEKIISTM